jgi:hypothetical protein
MQIAFNPKKQFQENKDVARELSTVVQSDNFQIALTSAFAHWAYARTPSETQVSAVREFISILLHLPHEDPPMPSLPIVELDRSVLQRRMPPTTTK